jgi:hypothetical protein
MSHLFHTAVALRGQSWLSPHFLNVFRLLANKWF